MGKENRWSDWASTRFMAAEGCRSCISNNYRIKFVTSAVFEWKECNWYDTVMHGHITVASHNRLGCVSLKYWYIVVINAALGCHKSHV